MDNQPTLNIGMIGSVSNGKSSITEKLTGIKTQKHSTEKERNITIKLGYANAKIYKCPDCQPPNCYQSGKSEEFSLNCKFCDQNMELKKHISIVDCPGHSLLMATMLNGTSVMDTSILVESAANSEPAQQTKEHLIATKLANLDKKIVCLNKMDLVKKDEGLVKMKKLGEYLNVSAPSNISVAAPIIPVAANHGINIDILCQYICELIPEPVRDTTSFLKMIIVRSFNVNKQEIPVEDLQGGIIGGTILKGKIKKGDQVVIYPGYINKNKYTPIKAKVLKINSEKNSLEEAYPGGLIGVQLDIDPGLTVKDGLVGNLVTTIERYADSSLKVYDTLFVEFTLLENTVITLEKNIIIVVNCNSNSVKGKIVKIRKDKMEIKLETILCVEVCDYITMSMANNGNSIIGRGKILDGLLSE